jgi:hypothetical protein
MLLTPAILKVPGGDPMNVLLRPPARGLLSLCLSFLAALALPCAAHAQDPRGAITGVVSDTSGGRLPGVTVVATSVDTNVPSTATTNNEGNYVISYLPPGKYTVTVELSGFKKVVRPNVEVRVSDRIDLDFNLEVGNIEETVSVTAESPLLEMGNASAGQVIDEKRIALMPLSDGNPFTLSRLVPGVAYFGDLKFSRPFDNAGTSDINADGSTGGNEFTLDGSPNMASGRRVAFVPPAGAVQEFKVSTASFDASEGHTAGAMVNVSLKSGTNRLKGESYYYKRDDRLSAPDFFVKKSGTEKPGLGYDRFGFNVGGPVWLPGYSGRDRTFFFGAVEWLYDEFPEPGPRTVPSEAMRNGDFSALLAQGIQIYDPLTGKTSGARVVRDPFPGNIIPANRINPLAQQVLKYYPLPNQAGDAQGNDNYFSTNPRTDDFYSISTRVDHHLTMNQRLFVRYTRNHRRESRNAYFGSVSGVTPTGNYLYRINDGVTGDHVWTVTNRTLLNLRGGWQRFQEPNVRQHQGLFDPASLGFPAGTVSAFNGARYFPLFNFDSLSDIGDNLAAATTHSIYSFQPTLTRLAGDHSIRIGYDMRLYREFSENPGRQAPEFQLTRGGAFTRAADNSTGLFGQDIANFILGFPTGGSIDRNATRLDNTWYNGVYVQDDWKLSNRLTLNLGLRYEYESPTYDSNNANVRGFDPAAAIGIASAVQAAYAARPIPEVAPSAFKVQGGVLFADDQRRGFYNPDRNNWEPRVGFAYELSSKTVVRGGVGIYAVPAIIAGNYQPGFSQNTPIVVSPDRGLTLRATLANPFPDGILEPVGSSLGPNTSLGQSVGRFYPLDAKNPMNARYMISVQRELPGQWLLDVGYTGSRGWDQQVDLDMNPVPLQYLTTSPVRDQTWIDYMGAAVANPFAGLIPSTGRNNATIARRELLRPFPQFTGVTSYSFDGSTTYDSGQVKIEHRFVRGYTLLAAYTFSKFTERLSKLNATDTSYEERRAASDIPHRIALSGILELPFGRGRHWGRDASGLTDALIGGWSVQAIGQLQSGRPSFTFGNLYYSGDPNALKAHYSSNTDVPVFDTSGFYFHDAAVQTNGVDDPAKQRNDNRIRLGDNVRYFPTRPTGLRGPTLNLWDISIVKQVRLAGNVRAQFNIEFLNAFNQTFFNDPNTDPTSANFGKVTSQRNLPRDIQLAAKIVF